MARKRTTPANPAAVSGPGALSQRTDGGPGSKTQPIRVAAGGPFGSRQELEDAQRAAPLPDNRSGPGIAEGGAGPGPPPQPAAEALFAPTGVPGPGGPRPTGNSFIPPDPDLLLKTIYQAFPHPEIRRLVNDITSR